VQEDDGMPVVQKTGELKEMVVHQWCNRLRIYKEMIAVLGGATEQKGKKKWFSTNGSTDWRDRRKCLHANGAPAWIGTKQWLYTRCAADRRDTRRYSSYIPVVYKRARKSFARGRRKLCFLKCQ
jgi:hypothetical protein